MRKMSLMGAVTTIFIIAPAVANAATLPSPVDGKITLTEDVTLDNKFMFNANDEITLDLNGYTLTGPTTNYAIDNRGTLKIVDNGTTKGSIVCPASTLSYDSSCVRNYNSMDIDGATINADWTAVKNEEASTLSINNAKISSVKSTAGVIMNYGNATIKNSSIDGNNDPYGAAIFALSYTENGTAYNSTSNIENTKIDAYYVTIQTKANKN